MTAQPATEVTRSYPMNNKHPHSPAHHAALAELLDPATVARLTALGDWRGATCLEVGAGGGSVARWLASQVGDEGQVFATDLDPDQIPQHPRLVRVKHDLRGDEPLPGSPHHLIVARLVLSHQAEREALLRRLAESLVPGGALVVADWAALRARDDIIIAAPSEEAADRYATYQRMVGEHVFDAASTDPTWARRIHPVMMAAGLTDVETHVSAQYWTGGGAGMRLVAALLQQVRPRLIAAGMTDEQLDATLVTLNDPGLVVHGHPLYITSGRRPE